MSAEREVLVERWDELREGLIVKVDCTACGGRERGMLTARGEGVDEETRERLPYFRVDPRAPCAGEDADFTLVSPPMVAKKIVWRVEDGLQPGNDAMVDAWEAIIARFIARSPVPRGVR